MENNQGETQLFLVRLWLDEPRLDEPRQGGGVQCGLEEGVEAHNYISLRWRGKVQHVVRGEAHAFTGWEMMISCLEAMLTRNLQGSLQGAEVTRAKANQAENQQAGENSW